MGITQLQNQREDGYRDWAALAQGYANSQTNLLEAVSRAQADQARGELYRAQAQAQPDITAARVNEIDSRTAANEALKGQRESATKLGEEAAAAKHDFLGIKGGKDVINWGMDKIKYAAQAAQMNAHANQMNAQAEETRRNSQTTWLSRVLDNAAKWHDQGHLDTLIDLTDDPKEKKAYEAYRDTDLLEHAPLWEKAAMEPDPGFRESVAGALASKFAKQHNIPQFVKGGKADDIGGGGGGQMENPDYTALKNHLHDRLERQYQAHYQSMMDQAQTMTERGNVEGQDAAGKKGENFKPQVEGRGGLYGNGPTPTQGYEQTDPTSTLPGTTSAPGATGRFPAGGGDDAKRKRMSQEGYEASAGKKAKGAGGDVPTFNPKGTYKTGDVIYFPKKGIKARLRSDGNWESV